MDKYTTSRELRQQKEQEPEPTEKTPRDSDPVQPSLADIMAAIQDVRGTLEVKIDSIVTEVNLLRADFRKTNESVGKQSSYNNATNGK